MSEVYDIIMRCAAIRGVSCLPHRSVEEFGQFVLDVLFGDELPGCDVKVHESYYLYVMKHDDLQLGLAEAFEMHCKEEL